MRQKIYPAQIHAMTNNPSRRNGAHTKSARPNDPADITVTQLGTWMTYADICDLLGETRNTLNKWRKRPEVGFPAGIRKPNGQLMFRRADIAAFIATLEVAA